MSEKKQQIRNALKKLDMTALESLMTLEEEGKLFQNMVDNVATAPQTASVVQNTIKTLHVHLKLRRSK